MKLRSPKDVEHQQRRSCWPFVKRKDLERIERKLSQIMATQTEIVAQLATVKTTLDKVAVEETALMVKIGELEAVIAGMGATATPELVAAVQAVADQAGVLDALVPDAPPPNP